MNFFCSIGSIPCRESIDLFAPSFTIHPSMKPKWRHSCDQRHVVTAVGCLSKEYSAWFENTCNLIEHGLRLLQMLQYIVRKHKIKSCIRIGQCFSDSLLPFVEKRVDDYPGIRIYTTYFSCQSTKIHL